MLDLLPDMILLSSTETFALLRDVFVIVFLSLAIISLLIFVFMSLSLYRRAMRVLDAADEAIERLESITELLDSVAGGARAAVNILSFGGLATRLFGRFRRSDE